MANKNIKLIIEAILQDKGFKTGVKGLQDSGTKTTSIWKKAWGAIGPVAAVAATIGLFKKVISITADLEQSIANVASVSKGSTKEIKALAKEAGMLGLGFSAKEAADAMYFLASAGLDVKDMSEVLTPTLRLAAAAQISIAEATDMVVNQLKTFNANMSDAESFTDIMAKTVASSNTDMRQLGGALSYASATAAIAGINFKDLNILIASMADQGIKGERAGTQLRMSFTRLMAPTADVISILKKYKLEILDVQKLIPTPLALMERLRVAFEQEIDPVQRAADATQLFGVRQANVAALMLKGEKFIIKNTEAIKGYAGAADEMAKTQLATFQGAMKNLNASLEIFADTVGTKILPILTKLINIVTDYATGAITASNMTNLFKNSTKLLAIEAENYNQTLSKTDMNLNQLKKADEEVIKKIAIKKQKFKDYADGYKSANEYEKTMMFFKMSNISQEIAALKGKQKAYTEMIKAIMNADKTDIAGKGAGLKAKKQFTAEELELKQEALMEYNEFVLEQEEFMREKLNANEEELQQGLQELRNKGLITETEYKNMSMALSEARKTKEKATEEEITKKHQEEVMKRLGQAQAFTNSISQLTTSLYNMQLEKYRATSDADKKTKEEQKKNLKKYWQINKAVSITDATIATAVGAMRAYQALSGIYMVGPILGAIAAAAVVAAGAIKISQIKSQTMPSFKTGTEKTEEGPAFLHEGERVIPANMNIPNISNAELMEAAVRGLNIPAVKNVTTEEIVNNTGATFSFAGASFNLPNVMDSKGFMEEMMAAAEETGTLIFAR